MPASHAPPHNSQSATSGTVARTRRRRWWMVVVLAGLLAWLVWFPPSLEGLSPLLSRYLSLHTGLQVTLRGLEMDARGLGLLASRVEVAPREGDPPLLTGDTLRVGLSPGDWFMTGRPLRVVAEQLHLHLDPTAAPDGEGSPADPLALLAELPVGALRLNQVQVTLVGDGWRGILLDLDGVQFVLNQQGEAEWSISGALTHGERVATLAFSGHWQPDFSWRALVRLEGLQPAALGEALSRWPALQSMESPVNLKVQIAGGVNQPVHAQWELLLGAGRFALPSLFRWPFPVTRMAARGEAGGRDGLWNLDVNSFEVVNEHGSGEGHFALTGLGGEEAHLDLTARARGVPTEKANYYYPVTIMDSAVVSWLDQSLLHGRVLDARVRIKGPLSQVPFAAQRRDLDGSETIFLIEGDVDNAAVQFYPGLPPVSQARTRLTFDRLSMEARVSGGTLVGSRKVQGKVRIADLLNQPLLEIDATARADLSSLWQHVVAHPVLDWDQAVGMAGTELKGEGDLTLAIRLPLATPERVSYHGGLDVTDGWVSLPFLSQPFAAVRGKLEADNTHLQIMVEHADHGGVPLFGTIAVDGLGTPDKTAILMKLRGELPRDWLGQRLSQVAEKPVTVTGNIPLNLVLDRQPGASGFRLESALTLKNAGLDGFPGLEKRPGEAAEAQLNGLLADDGTLKLKKMVVKLGSMDLSGQGDVNLGWLSQGAPVDKKRPLRPNMALQLKGVLPGESLTPWLGPLLGDKGSLTGPASWRLNLSSKPGKPGVRWELNADLAKLKGDGAWGWHKERGAEGQWNMTGWLREGGLLVLDRLKAKVGTLEATGSGEWRLRQGLGKLELKQAVLGRSQGKITVARQTEKESGTTEVWRLRADLQELDFSTELDKAQPEETFKEDEKPPQVTDREPWPHFALSLLAKQVTLAEKHQGKGLKLEMVSSGASLRLAELEMALGEKNVQADGEFSWLSAKDWGPYLGYVKVGSSDIGGLLKGMAWHQGMKGGDGFLRIRVEGNVPRGERLLRHLNGTARMKAKDGVIQKAKFLTTLLGLLSLPELPKLLTGDRPDLEGEGFYYKKMHGEAKLVDGVLKSEEFTLTGPSMTIVMDGDVDLPSRRLNLLVGARVFQTLDKIITQIPVVGKLIMGSRHALWETQFDVTGDMGDPDWMVRPVNSLAPGIFRDILDLPGKLLKMGGGEAETREPATQPPEQE